MLEGQGAKATLWRGHAVLPLLVTGGLMWGVWGKHVGRRGTMCWTAGRGLAWGHCALGLGASLRFTTGWGGQGQGATLREHCRRRVRSAERLARPRRVGLGLGLGLGFGLGLGLSSGRASRVRVPRGEAGVGLGLGLGLGWVKPGGS